MPTPQPDSQEFDIDVDDIDRLIAENEALGLHGNTADLDANFRRVGAKFRAKDRPLPDDLAALRAAILEASYQRIQGGGREGYTFGPYEVFNCMMGGMGMVLEAWDSTLQRKVAIKLWINEEADAELVREAQTLARLTFHPNIVTVFGIGTWNGRHYFVMEWIDGHNVRDWIEDRAMSPSWREVREVYLAAGAGLAAAHDMPDRPIQHRDFKPSNILVGNDGRVCVADFGLADTIRSSESTSETIAGTMSYIAPERLRGKKGDARSDQFSFCVSMWQTLRGRKGELLAEVPRCLFQTLRKGLDPDPDRRFPSMRALLQELAAAPAGDAAGEGGVESELLETGGDLHASSSADDVAVLDVRSIPHAAGEWSRTIRTTALGLVGGVVGALLVVVAYAGLREPDPTALPRLELETIEAIAAKRDELQRGMQKFEDANEAVGRHDNQAVIKNWPVGWELLIDEVPRFVGSESLELARRIDKQEPAQYYTAWIAVGAADAYEKAKDWPRAAEAAREAVRLFRVAKDETEANKQAKCVTAYEEKRPC